MRPENIRQSLSAEERKSSEMLLDFVNENLLVQVVTENTRKGKSLLDIVLTSNEDIISDTKVEKTNLDTDHDLVKCEMFLDHMNSGGKRKPNTEKMLLDDLNFDKAEWTPIREKLSDIEWNEVFSNDMSVKQMYEKLERIIYNSNEKHTPKHTAKEKKQSIPRNRLVLIRKRKRINARINYLKFVSTEEKRDRSHK